MSDELDAAWAQHEQLQHEFESELRETYPEWFIHRRDDMALVKDMIQSKFLRKEDFDEDQVCTIKDCKLEQVGKDDSPEERWVLYFREREKGMVLNITTIRVLESTYGGDTDHWVGNKVMVYVDPNVSFGGKVVGGLRLRTPKKVAVKAPVKTDDEFADDIPF
jgi:hypothetical protein